MLDMFSCQHMDKLALSNMGGRLFDCDGVGQFLTS